MADRIEEDADLAVAELRRKARRRLVGAVVLALAAAILLPLLLEREPRTLGEDVSIQIPPVDNGKFVNQLSPDKGKGAQSEAAPSGKVEEAAAPAAPATVAAASAASAPAADTAAPATKAAAAGQTTRPITVAADKNTGSSAAGASSSAPSASPASPASPAPSESTAPSAAPSPTAPPASSGQNVASAAPAPSPASTEDKPARSESGPSVTTEAPAESVKPEGFIVQLAAFTDAGGAKSLVNKVKKLGYPAYIEPHQARSGMVWRVRVGGYPTRAAANEALAKLKAEGHDGLVSAAK